MIRVTLLTLLIVAALYLGLALIGVNHAAPFVIADIPAAACNQCVWTGGPTGFAGTSAVVVDTVRGKPTFGNRICLRDVANAAQGTNNVSVACRDTTSLWEDSDSVPFGFVRPAPPLAPVDSRLAK
jgi:hypothetical protein